MSAGNSTAAPAHGVRFWLQLVASSKLVLGTQTLSAARVRAGEGTAEHWGSRPGRPVPRKDDLIQRDLELEGPGGPRPRGSLPQAPSVR